MMASVHGSDFVRVRAYGAVGDKGCDGYVQSTGRVFQCYGSLGAQESKVTYLINKMGTDFATALNLISKIMKEWHMVHNFVDGLPVPAIEKLDELMTANKDRKFGFIGLEGFEERIFSLEENKIEDLLGVIPTSLNFTKNLQPIELRDLVANISAAADEAKFDPSAIRPVPPDKLEYNKLPSHWALLIAGGWQNSHLVKTYFDRHPDPLTGGRESLSIPSSLSIPEKPKSPSGKHNDISLRDGCGKEQRIPAKASSSASASRLPL